MGAKRKAVKRKAAVNLPPTIEAAPPPTLGRTVIPGTSVSMPARPGPAHELVPERNPHYLFREEYVEEIAWAVEMGENVMLVGDTSTGKSSLVEQLAAHTNTPVRRVPCHGESATTLFVGTKEPDEVDGKRCMVYVEGLLATAMREGHWLLLDEIDAALQPVLFVLQHVLEDDGKLLLEDGKGTVIRKHPDFRIFATGNTVGAAGRHRVLYTGTMGRMNEATLDRFGCVIHLPYMSPDQETQVICREVPDLDDDFVKAIVRISNEVRTEMENEHLSCTMGLRRNIHWAKAMTKFHPLRAAKFTILNKLNADDSKVLEGVIQRYFGS